MKDKIKYIYNHFGEDIVVPLFNFKKYSTDKDWQNKKYTLKSFNKSTGIAIKINKCNDLCCLDVDIKTDKFDDETIKKVKNLIIDFALKTEGVYLEQTQSGAFHLFFKLKKKELEEIHNDFSSDDRHVAKEIELFPNKQSSSRLIVIAPSKGENGIYKSLIGDITKCKYININKIKSLIMQLRRIVGEHSPKKTIINKNKTFIEIDIDKVYKEKTEKFSDKEKNMLYELKEIILENNLTEYFLKYLDISYIEKEKTFNLYSIITDDGKNPDAYLFKDTLVYFDFHNNKGYNFVYLVYLLYKEKVVSFYKLCKKIYKDINDEFEYNDNTIEVDSINDVKDELLIGKKLLVASTGSGKTQTIKKLAESGNKIIMLEPLTIQVLQEDRQNKVNVACFCEGAINNNITNQTTLIFCTYDKFPEVIKKINLDEWKIVVDEAHELICALSYRKNVIEFIWSVLEQREQYLLMTATNHLLFLNDYVDVCYKVKTKEKKNRSFYHIKTNSIIKQIVENVLLNYNQDVIQFVYIDSKNELKKLFNNLLENGIDFNDIVIVNSDNKIYDAKDIINEMKTTKKIYLSTRVLSAGFHILSDNKYLYHIVPNDINVLIQETNRVREYNDNEVILFIYHNRRYKQEDIDFDVEWRKTYIKKIKFVDKIKEKIEEYKNINNKEYLDGNWNLYNATKNEYWIRYLTYKQFIIKASKNIKFITNALINEGFKECQELYMETDTKLINYDDITDYDELFEKLLNEGIKVSDKDNKLKRELMFIVNKIKMYPEVFDENDIKIYKEKIKNGKIRDVKISITKKINFYALKHLDIVGCKTKAILETKINEINKILKNKYSISKNTINKLIEDYNITRVEMNTLLKANNFKWDKKKKRYIKTN